MIVSYLKNANSGDLIPVHAATATEWNGIVVRRENQSHWVDQIHSEFPVAITGRLVKRTP